MGSGERKKASSALQQQGLFAQRQGNLSRQLLDESAPWRAIAGKYYTDVAKGGDELTRSVAPQINATTMQYQTALKRAREMPAGGSRDRMVREIRLGEAGTKAGIYSGGVQDAVNKLTSMSQFNTGAGMEGYGAAGSGYSSVARSYSDMARDKGQQVAGMAGGLGGLTAMVGGGKGSGTPGPSAAPSTAGLA
jgi:hypothetical protein